MGWKTIKQHYGIKHIVQVSKRKEYSDEPVIMIGSPYISDIIVIRISDGKLLKRYDSGRANELLQALQPKLDDDETSGKLKELIDEKDQFDNLLPVYYIGDRRNIRLMYCEEYGYPNCTTDGRLMYENLYLKNLKDAKDYLVHRTKIDWFVWRHHVADRWKRAFEEIRRMFRWEFGEIADSIYVRCWGRFFVNKNHYDKYD